MRKVQWVERAIRLTAIVKLMPDEAQAKALRDTIRACNYAATVARERKGFNRKALHRLVYRGIRDRFGLPAQLAVHVISKVVESYADRRNRNERRAFKELGAVRYDSRILSLKLSQRLVSIATLQGRLKIPFTAGERQFRPLERPVRELTSWLFIRKEEFYLAVVCEVDDPETINPEGILGVDVGQVNLATESTGECFSGEALTRVRLRYAQLRRRLQKRGTQSAKRHLRKLSRKERNFTTTTNHTIARRLVEKAQRHRAAIALENLKGIRARTTVQKGRNRRSQSEFVCRSCGCSDHADRVAAVNIAARAAVNQPIVGWGAHHNTSLRQAVGFGR